MRLVLTAMVAWLFGAGIVDAGVLDRVRETGTLRLGYRADALPFSFKDVGGVPAGYSVELCKAVARELADRRNLKQLKLEFVEVTAENRLGAVAEGRIDLLCEATTATLERRAQVDFSLLTFATGAGLLYRADGPASFDALRGQKVGVLAGTTTADEMRETFARSGIEVDFVPVTDHPTGLRRLAAGEFAAYLGDGAILIYQWFRSPDRERLKLAEKMLTFEPYALALPRGDADFRLLVDGALSRLYRSGEINRLFTASFPGAEPTELIKSLYLLQGLPD